MWKEQTDLARRSGWLLCFSWADFVFSRWNNQSSTPTHFPEQLHKVVQGQEPHLHKLRIKSCCSAVTSPTHQFLQLQRLWYLQHQVTNLGWKCTIKASGKQHTPQNFIAMFFTGTAKFILAHTVHSYWKHLCPHGKTVWGTASNEEKYTKLYLGHFLLQAAKKHLEA